MLNLELGYLVKNKKIHLKKKLKLETLRTKQRQKSHWYNAKKLKQERVNESLVQQSCRCI